VSGRNIVGVSEAQLPTAPIPPPAAGWLPFAGLGGLGLPRLRKRA
jgi:hypothetical protein